MYYGEKRASLVVISNFLRQRGWEIYGYKKDQSDFMTDYYDPASWNGIAAKNGYILVIDNYADGKIGGSFIQKSYDIKVSRRIKKLIALRDNHAASPGEKANAQTILDQLDSKMVEEVVCDTGLPEITYRKNPCNSKWHIERDGKIVAKGTGVFLFGSLQYSLFDESLVFSKYEDNPRYFDYYTKDSWNAFYQGIIKERREKIKILDKLERLLNKWDKLATIKIGNGKQETLVEKTVTKEKVYFVAKDSPTKTDYIRIGDKWRKYHGLEKGFVYKLVDNNYIKKLTKKYTTFSDGTRDFTYGLEPRKTTKAKLCWIDEKDFASGDVVYVDLVPKREIFQETAYVKSKVA